MKTAITRRFLPLMLAAAAVFLLAPKAEAQTTTHYTGHLGPVPVNMKIVWENYNGLGKIWGTMNYAGRRLTFSGANSRPGYLWFRDSDGITYTLSKLNTSSTIGWSGSSGSGEKFTLSRRR